MIKIIIANNNDVLYNNLYNFLLKNELNIEITKITNDELNKLVYKIKPKDNLVILDSFTSTTFCTNILNNILNYKNTNKSNIIILVADSNILFKIKNERKNNFLRH